ncbi:MAG: YtxH domain-containing protein [Nitrospira sp.]
MHKEDVSYAAFAFIAGATVGAGAMLLFAPQAGSDFRSSVRDYARRATDEWDKASEGGESTLDTVLQRGKEWIQSAMPKQDNLAEKAQMAGGPMGSGEQGARTAGDTGQDN